MSAGTLTLDFIKAGITKAEGTLTNDWSLPQSKTAQQTVAAGGFAMTILAS